MYFIVLQYFFFTGPCCVYDIDQIVGPFECLFFFFFFFFKKKFLSIKQAEKKKKGICRDRTDFYSIILCTCRKENSRGRNLIKQLHRRLFPFTIKLCASPIANMSALRRGDLAGVGVCVCTDEPSVVNVSHGVNNSVVSEVDGNSTPGSNDGSRS